MLNSRSGQIAYFHGVTTRLSTLGTGDIPRGSDLGVAILLNSAKSRYVDELVRRIGIQEKQFEDIKYQLRALEDKHRRHLERVGCSSH